MFIMECAKNFNVSEALLEVEKDLSLPSNSLVDGMPSPKISRKVGLKKMKIFLDQNFMARVPDIFLRHSCHEVLV